MFLIRIHLCVKRNKSQMAHRNGIREIMVIPAYTLQTKVNLFTLYKLLMLHTNRPLTQVQYENVEVTRT
jgi:hypothetical protein